MSLDLTTEDGARQYMERSTSETDWNKRTDAVKAANGGYPPFWHKVAVKSGLVKVIAPETVISIDGMDAEGNITPGTKYDPVTDEIVG